MTESRYKIIPINQSVHTDQEDDGEEDDELTDNIDDDTVTIVPANDSGDLHFPNEFNEHNNMHAPTAILSLILIYFTLSIGLTFYQRNLLKVNISHCVLIYLSVLNVANTYLIYCIMCHLFWLLIFFCRNSIFRSPSSFTIWFWS